MPKKEPREIYIDGCLDFAFEVHSRTVKLTLYSARHRDGKVQKEEVARLTMPESGAVEMMYCLTGALPKETMMRILQEAFASTQHQH